MNDLETRLQYAKDKIHATQLPPSLYQRAERRAIATDILGTVAVTAVLLFLATCQFRSGLKAQPAPVAQIAREELVATRAAR